MKGVHVFISGRVQGVAFRHYTVKTARSLNLAGWVRNLDDGRVEAVFEGRDDDIDAMLAWCRRGPSLARVDHVEIHEEALSGRERDFRIRY
jgi:acylphosphatase